MISAGNKILEIYNSNNFETMFKDDNSPLTNADVNQIIIVNYLNSSDIPILSEEEKHVSYEIRSKWNGSG